jgi:hypothetical protein
MTDLSPAAQAVLDAFLKAPMGQSHVDDDLIAIAAALRAVAEHCKCDDGEGYWIYRPNILAIAAELEGSND